MNNKHKEKVKLALELINKKGLSAQRAAETMGVTVKEIERVK
jgi:plasmid maintenance system antidote protein VapI